MKEPLLLALKWCARIASRSVLGRSPLLSKAAVTLGKNVYRDSLTKFMREATYRDHNIFAFAKLDPDLNDRQVILAHQGDDSCSPLQEASSGPMLRGKRFNWRRISSMVLFLTVVNMESGSAQALRIAVAANAQGLIKKLQADFKKRTGIESEAIIGASGKLTAQMMNGAPFDVFLSADTEFPDQLFAAGMGLKKPMVYAMGSLIVCGNTAADIRKWRQLISGTQFKKVAIANPKTAPYGKAAEESLRYYQLLEGLRSRLVYGESISQVNTYLQTGVVTIGFTTEAFLYENIDKSHLKWARVEEKSYTPIAQAAILLSYAKKGKLREATAFFDYLGSAAARKIIGSSGYRLPLTKK